MNIVSVSAATALTSEVIRSPEALKELGPGWADLFSRAGCENVFLSFDWMEEWWRCYGKGQGLFIVALRDATGELVGVGPFCICPDAARRWRVRGLKFLASKWVCSDHLDILAAPGLELRVAAEVARIIVEHRNEWHHIELTDYDAESPTMAALRDALIRSGLREQLSARGVCPYIPLPASFDAYVAGLNPIWRYSFRRAMRMTQRAGALRHLVFKDYAAIEEHFPEFLRLHRLRFEQRGERSTFLEDTNQAFHWAVLGRVGPRGWARLYLLELDGKAVAGYYGFCVRSKFLVMQTGFDPAWSRRGVGNVMVGLAIQESIRSGHDEFDFLRGDEQYKFHWTRSTREAITVRLFQGTATGSLLFAASSLAAKWAAIRHALRLYADARPSLRRLAGRISGLRRPTRSAGKRRGAR